MSRSTSGAASSVPSVAAATDRPARGDSEPEAVVVDRDAERARRRARQPVAEQRREAEVREPAFERIEEEVVAVARRDALDQPLALVGQRRPAPLQLEQRPHELAARATRRRRASRRAISLRVRSASSVDSGIFAPIQRGTIAGVGGAGFTHAVISRTRTNSSTRPANTKQSPGAQPRDERLLDVAERACRCASAR